LSHAISQPFACDVKPATITFDDSLHGVEKKNNMGLINYSFKNVIHLIVPSVTTWLTFPKGCAHCLEKEFDWRKPFVCTHRLSVLQRCSPSTINIRRSTKPFFIYLSSKS